MTEDYAVDEEDDIEELELNQMPEHAFDAMLLDTKQPPIETKENDIEQSNEHQLNNNNENDNNNNSHRSSPSSSSHRRNKVALAPALSQVSLHSPDHSGAEEEEAFMDAILEDVMSETEEPAAFKQEEEEFGALQSFSSSMRDQQHFEESVREENDAAQMHAFMAQEQSMLEQDLMPVDAELFEESFMGIFNDDNNWILEEKELEEKKELKKKNWRKRIEEKRKITKEIELNWIEWRIFHFEHVRISHLF